MISFKQVSEQECRKLRSVQNKLMVLQMENCKRRHISLTEKPKDRVLYYIDQAIECLSMAQWRHKGYE